MTAVSAITALAQIGMLVPALALQTALPCSARSNPQTPQAQAAKSSKRMATRRSLIPGSEQHLREGQQWVSTLPPDQQVTATILIRRPPAVKNVDRALLSGNYHPSSREAAEASLAATPDDMKTVEDFARAQGLEVFDADPAKRRIRIRGTAAQMDSAFGIQLGSVALPDGKRVESYRGALSVPIQLDGIISAVLGLDNRPVASPRKTD